MSIRIAVPNKWGKWTISPDDLMYCFSRFTIPNHIEPELLKGLRFEAPIGKVCPVKHIAEFIEEYGLLYLVFDDADQNRAIEFKLKYL